MLVPEGGAVKAKRFTGDVSLLASLSRCLPSMLLAMSGLTGREHKLLAAFDFVVLNIFCSVHRTMPVQIISKPVCTQC